MAILTRENQIRINNVIHDVSLKLGFSYPEMNILELALAANIKVYEIDLTEIGASGIITYENARTKNSPSIFLNKGMSRERKVFTLAHELGHHFLHKGEKLRLDTLDYSKDDNDTKEESEANYFAASILVPKKLLEYRKSKGDSTSELASYFKVSIPVIKNRLRWVDVNGQ